MQHFLFCERIAAGWHLSALCGLLVCFYVLDMLGTSLQS